MPPTLAPGYGGRKFRAFDKATGAGRLGNGAARRHHRCADDVHVRGKAVHRRCDGQQGTSSNRFHRAQSSMRARQSRHWTLAIFVLGAGVIAAMAVPIAQGVAARTVSDGVYSEAQAARGKAVYEAQCAFCHQSDLRGQGFAPGLVEDVFSQQMAGRQSRGPVYDRQGHDAAGQAGILDRRGIRGDRGLPAAGEPLSGRPAGAASRSSRPQGSRLQAAGHTEAVSGFRNLQFTIVNCKLQSNRSALMLRLTRILALAALAATTAVVLAAQRPPSNSAAAGEWRYYGGDAGSTKYSPLDQITRANVNQLRDRLALELARQRDRQGQSGGPARRAIRTRRSW